MIIFEPLSGELQLVPGAPAGASVAAEAEQVVIDFVASENLTQYDPVTLTGSKADSADLAGWNRVIGLVLEDVESGFMGRALVEGIIEADWDWTPGTKLFLNGSVLSPIPPVNGFSQMIAVAQTDMAILVQPQPAIRL